MAGTAPDNSVLRYSIDASRFKYASRYDRLLNLLFYAKELPSNLYTQMNMSYVNFRKAVSILKQRGILKKIHRDGAIGYILTSEGKSLIHKPNYMMYRDCLEEEARQYDIVHRLRKRQFAYLYSLFDRIGIPYESFRKPIINNSMLCDDKVYFYTAQDFKRLLGASSTTFRGSRLLGFLIGSDQVIPVYRTNRMLKTFANFEALVPIFLSSYFSTPATTALLICDDEDAAADITTQIISNRQNDPNAGVNTAQYKEFYILPSDDNFLSRFEDLYTDYFHAEQQIIIDYGIDTSDYDSRGRRRFKIGTGYLGDSPVLVCLGNINTVTLNYFIRNAEINNQQNYIFCTPRDIHFIKRITNGKPVQLIVI